MQNQKFDHTLVLKMSTEMRDDIDRALTLVQDTLIRSRSEFIRAACQLFLDSLAKKWGCGPVSLAERKERVLAGTDEADQLYPEATVHQKGFEDTLFPRELFRRSDWKHPLRQLSRQ